MIGVEAALPAQAEEQRFLRFRTLRVALEVVGGGAHGTGAIIERLALRRPIYRPTAAYGHFGRSDLDLSWERTDLADELRQAARPAGTAA